MIIVLFTALEMEMLKFINKLKYKFSFDLIKMNPPKLSDIIGGAIFNLIFAGVLYAIIIIIINIYNSFL